MMSLAKKSSRSATASVLIMIIVQATGAQTVDDSQKLATLRIVSNPSGATVFGWASVGACQRQYPNKRSLPMPPDVPDYPHAHD